MKYKPFIFGMAIFCIAFFYLSIQQMRFIIAEKSCDLDSSKNKLALAESSKQALFYNKHNPLYYLNTGCYYAQVDSIDSKIITRLVQDRSIELHYMDSSYKYISEAYKMYPEEPIFALNFSLIELFKGNSNNSIKVLEPFINNTEDNNLELLCVLGLGYETIGKTESAINTYSLAVSHLPEIIRSDFFKELKYRDSLMAIKILDSAETILQREYYSTKDPMVSSRLGSLMFEIGDLDRAEYYLFEAVNDLPSLNRPWYYLGLIKQMNGDDGAINYFVKSHYLDRTDMLPVRIMVSYGEPYQDLLDYLKQNKSSSQSQKISRLFNGSTMRYPYLIADLEQYLRIKDI